MVNNLEAEDIMSETCNMNSRYKYTTNGIQHSSGLDPLNYFVKTVDSILDIRSVICMVVYCKPCNNMFVICIVREKIF